MLETFFDGEVLWRAWPLLWEGLLLTVQLGALSIVLGWLGGLALALLGLYGPASLRALVRAYVDVFRALPVLVLLILVYYALPFVGLSLSAFASATLALAAVSSAYTSEIVRAGIEAVPKGQSEAGRVLGLSFPQILRLIVLPQAFRLVIPPLTGNSINVLKDTALASVVAMPDLLKQATQAQALEANPTPLIAAAGLYLLILLPLVAMVRRLERRLGRPA